MEKKKFCLVRGFSWATILALCRRENGVCPRPARSPAPILPGMPIKSTRILACVLFPYLGLSRPKFGVITLAQKGICLRERVLPLGDCSATPSTPSTGSPMRARITARLRRLLRALGYRLNCHC